MRTSSRTVRGEIHGRLQSKITHWIINMGLFCRKREATTDSAAAQLPTIFRDRTVSPLEDEPRPATAVLDQLDGT